MFDCSQRQSSTHVVASVFFFFQSMFGRDTMETVLNMRCMLFANRLGVLRHVDVFADL